MSPQAVTLAWAAIMVVQLVTWVVAWVRTIGDPEGRLPVMVGAVPAMYGTLVYSFFVETWVLGRPEPWTTRLAPADALWVRYWDALAFSAPVIVAMGLWGLWMRPRTGWSMSARLAGMASLAAALAALAALPAA